MKNLFDNHNHCEFSFDGKRTTVEASARVAAVKGLGGLCFADHCDIFVPEQTLEFSPRSNDLVDVAAQQKEIDRVQEMFPQIRILKGIEIGMHENCREEINMFNYTSNISIYHCFKRANAHFTHFCVKKYDCLKQTNYVVVYTLADKN